MGFSFFYCSTTSCFDLKVDPHKGEGVHISILLKSRRQDEFPWIYPLTGLSFSSFLSPDVLSLDHRAVLFITAGVSYNVRLADISKPSTFLIVAGVNLCPGGLSCQCYTHTHKVRQIKHTHVSLGEEKRGNGTLLISIVEIQNMSVLSG